MTVRELIADKIKADNLAEIALDPDTPTLIVKAFPASPPDTLGAGKAHVAVYRRAITPNQTQIKHELEIEILVGGSASLATEEILDIALDEVLKSIERLPSVIWTDTARDIFYDKFHGYKVTVELTSPNVYKNIVREEQKAV